jgi:hypothetical protein
MDLIEINFGKLQPAQAAAQRTIQAAFGKPVWEGEEFCGDDRGLVSASEEFPEESFRVAEPIDFRGIEEVYSGLDAKIVSGADIGFEITLFKSPKHPVSPGPGANSKRGYFDAGFSERNKRNAHRALGFATMPLYYKSIVKWYTRNGRWRMVFGNVAFISSGETSQTGGQIFRKLADPYPKGFRIAILETPAGFELNSARVAERVADSIALRFGEKTPRIDVLPARRKGTPHSPDAAELLQPLQIADLIYMGAGSPTYAARQLRDSLAWQTLLASWQQGAGLVFASAAAVAMGRFTLPVYEIFKAGEDPEWKPGLDLLGGLGWSLAIVSHWNNAEGGAELDTSRCFIGRERFDALARLLPSGTTILGLDEHTAAILDLHSGRGHVEGRGTITLLRDGQERIHPAGGEFSLDELGEYRIPSEPFGVDPRIWEEILTKRQADGVEPIPPPEVAALLQEREQNRKGGEFAKADGLRKEIESLGWGVMDTPQGAILRPLRKG